MLTDQLVGAGVTMDITHHKVHNEQLYTGANTCTIGAATTMYYLLRTPASANEVASHARFSFNATGAIQATLFEAVTASTNTGESSIVFRNNDRNAVSASTTKVTFARALTANVTPGNTILDVSGATAGAPQMLPAMVGGEWILNSNTTYALQIMNANAALTTNVSVACYFYQENAK